jgi:ribose 5-phosphate isomerase B
VKIAIGNDHAGYPLRDQIIATVQEEGHEVIDMGAHSDAPIDYPIKAFEVAKAVAEGRADRGIVACGSGAGVSVAATKVPGVRAVSITDHYSAHQAVEHDNMNVLCFGARVIGPETAKDLIRAFLNAEYQGDKPGGERHARRLAEVNEIEARGLDANLTDPESS